eukprot:m.57596 g.57596  ORF g.57596 m.57596 type:complete len:77 (+) comp11240_c0_seq1:36-266(+)
MNGSTTPSSFLSILSFCFYSLLSVDKAVWKKKKLVHTISYNQHQTAFNTVNVNKVKPTTKTQLLVFYWTGTTLGGT